MQQSPNDRDLRAKRREERMETVKFTADVLEMTRRSLEVAQPTASSADKTEDIFKKERTSEGLGIEDTFHRKDSRRSRSRSRSRERSGSRSPCPSTTSLVSPFLFFVFNKFCLPNNKKKSYCGSSPHHLLFFLLPFFFCFCLLLLSFDTKIAATRPRETSCLFRLVIFLQKCWTTWPTPKGGGSST